MVNNNSVDTISSLILRIAPNKRTRKFGYANEEKAVLQDTYKYVKVVCGVAKIMDNSIHARYHQSKSDSTGDVSGEEKESSHPAST
jgi:hypothetical protein